MTTKEYNRQYYLKHREETLFKLKMRRKNNPEEARARNREWCKNNPEKLKLKTQKWRINHPDVYKKSQKETDLKRRSTPQGKINILIGNLIRHSIKHGKNGCHWELLVGYTIDQLKTHLQKKFKPGMSWDNYGQWHVDHIIPVSVYNFETPDDIDFKKCWALKNLQPLWAKENIIKHNKINKPHQPSLLIAA